MKIIILGSGVIGTASAYFLAQAGHDVTVIDRQPGSGLETSFGNAGEISPGYATPWAGPGVPAKALKWLTMQHSPLVIRPTLDRAPVALDPADAGQLQYPQLPGQQDAHGAPGRIQPRRAGAAAALTPASPTTSAARARCSCFARRSSSTARTRISRCCVSPACRIELLDPAGCTRYEPALARVPGKYVGGLLLPNDETGDCFKFTQGLAETGRGPGRQVPLRRQRSIASPPKATASPASSPTRAH